MRHRLVAWIRVSGRALGRPTVSRPRTSGAALSLALLLGSTATAGAYNGLPDDLSGYHWRGTVTATWNIPHRLGDLPSALDKGSMSFSDLRREAHNEVAHNYSALISGSGTYDSYGSCGHGDFGVIETHSYSASDLRYGSDPGTNGNGMAIGISSRPEGISIHNGANSLPAVLESKCNSTFENREFGSAGVLNFGYVRQDTDPDPARVVGRTEWTKDDPPESPNTPVEDGYRYSVTYDLTLTGPCSNGKDDDADGKIDFPDDPDCGSTLDGNEAELARTPVTVLLDGPGRVDGLPGSCVRRFAEDLPCVQAMAPAGGTIVLTAHDFAPGAFQRWEGCDATVGSLCTVNAGQGDPRTVKAIFDPVLSYAPRAYFDTGKQQSFGVKSDGPEDYFPGEPGQFVDRAELRLYLPPGAIVCGQRPKGTRWRTERRKLIASARHVTIAKLKKGHWKRRICPLLGRGGSRQGRPTTIRSDELTAPAASDEALKRPKGSRAGFYLEIPNARAKSTRRYFHGVPTRGAVGPKMPFQFEGGRSIVYWFFYPYNDRDYDRHQGDWEHIAVRLDGDNRLSDVAYYFHYCDPKILAASQVSFEEGTHPLTFVAGGGHGTWPSVGVDKINCKFGFGGVYDTRDRGISWDSWRSGLVAAETQPWFDLGVGWGRDGGIGWGPVGPGPRKSGTRPAGW